MGLFDALRGQFDDVPYGDVPPEHHRALSIQGNLKHVLNTSLGSSMASPQIGIPDLTGFLEKFQTDTGPLSQAIEQAIIAGEPRVDSAKCVDWKLGPGGYPTCVLALRNTAEKALFRYRFVLRGLGGNKVETWNPMQP